jgi:hypothetical protein
MHLYICFHSASEFQVAQEDGDLVPDNNVAEYQDMNEELDNIYMEPKVVPFDTTKSLWEDNIELNWVKVLTRDDLLAVRNFIKKGIDISIVEEKVSSVVV